LRVIEQTMIGYHSGTEFYKNLMQGRAHEIIGLR
jgi:hypothetical protein